MANPIVPVPTTPFILQHLAGAVTLAGATGNWSVGDEIQGKVAGGKAIITEVISPGATPTLRFYHIDPFTAFNGTEGIQNNTDTGDSTSSGAVTILPQDIDLSTCRNYKGLPDIQGGVLLRITVTVGSIQFSIDSDPDALSPVYVVDDLVLITLYKGNTLKMKGAAQLDACNIVL